MWFKHVRAIAHDSSVNSRVTKKISRSGQLPFTLWNTFTAQIINDFPQIVLWNRERCTTGLLAVTCGPPDKFCNEGSKGSHSYLPLFYFKNAMTGMQVWTNLLYNAVYVPPFYFLPFERKFPTTTWDPVQRWRKMTSRNPWAVKYSLSALD